MSDRESLTGERRMGAPLDDRVVVVQAEGPEGLRSAAVAVGVSRFRRPEGERLGVIVKLTLAALDRRGHEVVASVATPSPLSLDRPSRFPSPLPGLLDYASDFAPEKAAIDLLIVGHAEAASGTIAVAGKHVLAFRAAEDGGGPIPLAPAYLATDASTATLGPMADEARYRSGQFEAGLDGALFNAAPLPQRLPLGSIAADATLTLRGLLPDGATTLRLPGLQPVVTWDGELAEYQPVTMALDTVWLDTDSGEIALVWRGAIRLVRGSHEVSRLVVSLERSGRMRDAETRLADCQRGRVQFAATEDDLARGVVPPEDDPELLMAKLSTWSSVAPDPRLPLDRYATIAAELAEQPEARGAVLDRHGLDEHRWVVEERSWLERMAAAVSRGDSALAEQYGGLYLAAENELAKPEEERWTLADYARLRVALEQAIDPLGVLSEVPMTLPQWSRLERRWLSRAEGDERIAAELERLLEEHGRSA